MSDYKKFKLECNKEIEVLGADHNLKKQSIEWMKSVNLLKYSYHFEWLGRPIIQYPQDMIAIQELIWMVKPDLIIETGIAHGGSLIFSASLMAQLDLCDAIESGIPLDPKSSRRKVLGIDIDIREHNRNAIEAHPMASWIEMIQGSSIDENIISRVHKFSSDYSRILVFLDSNHTHEHVLAELEAYASLVSLGSYCCVFDTIVEDMSDNMFLDRSWGKGNNPKTAVWKYLETHSEFEIDKDIQNKLLITVAPDGYLKKIKN
jgi:cephalosporin hydroxylase